MRITKFAELNFKSFTIKTYCIIAYLKKNYLNLIIEVNLIRALIVTVQHYQEHSSYHKNIKLLMKHF